MTATPEALAHVIQVRTEAGLKSHLSAHGSETDYGIAALCGRWYKASDVVTEHAEVDGDVCSDCLGALPIIR